MFTGIAIAKIFTNAMYSNAKYLQNRNHSQVRVIVFCFITRVCMKRVVHIQLTLNNKLESRLDMYIRMYIQVLSKSMTTCRHTYRAKSREDSKQSSTSRWLPHCISRIVLIATVDSAFYIVSSLMNLAFVLFTLLATQLPLA